MKKFLIERFRHPFIWILFYGILILLGFFAFNKIPVEILPKFNFPQIRVLVRQPGATAEEIENMVVRPLESQILSLQGVDTIRSNMGEGNAEIDVRFNQNTNAILDLQLVRSALSRVSAELPAGVVAPKAQIMGNSINEVADYGIKVNKSSLLKTQRDIKTKIIPLLRAIKGVQRVDLFGEGAEAFWIQPNLDAMRRYGVSLEDIAHAVRQRTVIGPDGYITLGHKDLMVQTSSLPKSALALGKTLVESKQGKVPLSVIAQIKHLPIPTHNAALLDRESSVIITVFKQPEASTLPVTKAVAKVLKEHTQELPKGTKWIKIYSQGHLVKLIGSDLGRNLIVGGLLAIAVLFLILGAGRQVLILSITIPLSLLLAVAGLYWSGHTLNLLTFGALTIAIGLLVDDSIIVFESIYHSWEEGYSNEEGVIHGLRTIASPDISGTLTTVAAFAPLLFVGGLAGLFFTPFSLAMIFALLASLLISLTLIPLSMRFMKKREASHFNFGSRFIEYLHNKNEKLLRFALVRPRTSLSLALLLFFSSIAFVAFITVNFLPLPNEGVLLESFALPPGTSLKQTEKVVQEITKKIEADPIVAHTYARIGSASSTFYTETIAQGEIEIVLKPSVNVGDLNSLSEHFLKISKMDGVQFDIDTPTIERLGESLSGLPQPFVLRLFGSNISTLRTLSKEITAKLQKTHDLFDIFNDDGYPVTQIRLEPRLLAMQTYGISSEALQKELALLLGGKILTRIPRNDYSIDVYLRMKHVHTLSMQELKSLPIHTPKGWIPLKMLTNVKFIIRPNIIRHFNGARELDITAFPSTSLGSAIKDAKKAIATLDLPSGYYITFGGLYPQIKHAVITLSASAILALIIILAILIIQFEKMLIPGLLLLQIPLAFTGGALALGFSGVGLNAIGIIGFFTLMGISLNHGIVLLHRIKQNEAKGMQKEDAILEGVHVRFRPIFLTTMTAILGMLPTALGWGKGAAPEQSLAIVIMGGILWSALLSTNLLPALYAHWSKN